MIFNPNITLNENGNNYIIDLRSKLFEQRIIMLDGEINTDLSIQIISQLIYLDSISHDDITIYINSPGGSINDGLAIYDTMNFVKSDIRVICIGLAASMAAVILSSGTKGKRMILPNADVMIHQPLINQVSGQTSEITAISKRMNELRIRVNTILANNCEKTIKRINVDTKSDKFFNAYDAVKYGLVDMVIDTIN